MRSGIHHRRAIGARAHNALLLLLLVLGAAACEPPTRPETESLFNEPSDSQSAPGPAGDPDDIQVTRITATTLSMIPSGERLVLSASGDEEALLFDPSEGPIDFGMLDLVCPNGQQMPMDAWLVNLAEEQGADLAALTADDFSLAGTEEVAIGAIDGDQSVNGNGCIMQCTHHSLVWCTDGQWVARCDQWKLVCPQCNPCDSENPN